MNARAPVLVAGAMGRMGAEVRAALAAHKTMALGAALEMPGHAALGRELSPGVTLGCNAAAALAGMRAAIVFAPPAPALELLRLAAAAGVPCAVGTTGFSAAQREEISALAARCGVVLAANFSVAVNVLLHLTRRAAEKLGAEYDAEIVELHHSAKVDAPSGTALALGEAVAQGRGGGVLDSGAREGARRAGAVGVQSLRGGDNPGEHTVLFLGRGERLELTHRAATRAHFARGAVAAAQWLQGRPPGLYSMARVLGL